MSAATQPRAARPANLVNFPSDYPNPHRLQGTDFLPRALADSSKPTFYKYRKAGLIPEPDARFGHRTVWKETTIASTVEAFAARSRNAA